MEHIRLKKCPDCGKPYKVYAHYFGDQSKCIDCRNGVQEIKNPSWKFERSIKEQIWRFDQNSKTLPINFAI